MCAENQYDWPADVFAVLKKTGITRVATVPDGGLITILRSCEQDPAISVITLTTEGEGVAFCSGAWLAGDRAVLMIQSSGVGNIVNMLSLPESCGMPLLMLVTMRGEQGEFNPWQVPMGQAVPSVLEAMNVKCHRPEYAADIGAVFEDAAHLVFESRTAAAVLVRQRIIGAKEFD